MAATKQASVGYGGVLPKRLIGIAVGCCRSVEGERFRLHTILFR